MNFSKQFVLRECSFKTSRSSGKGGQHTNKVESRVSIFFDVENSKALSDSQKEKLKSFYATTLSNNSIIQVDVEAHRSQLKNKQLAKDRLIQSIELALKKVKKRIPLKPSKKAIKKRLEEKKKKSEKKQFRKKDFL